MNKQTKDFLEVERLMAEIERLKGELEPLKIEPIQPVLDAAYILSQTYGKHCSCVLYGDGSGYFADYTGDQIKEFNSQVMLLEICEAYINEYNKLK
jgi:hypothetical protein